MNFVVEQLLGGGASSGHLCATYRSYYVRPSIGVRIGVIVRGEGLIKSVRPSPTFMTVQCYGVTVSRPQASPCFVSGGVCPSSIISKC